MSEEFVSKSQDPNINLLEIAQLNNTEHQRFLSSIVERQIEGLNDLDFNLFEDDEQLSNTILVDVIMIVNDNYIAIPGIETITVDPHTIAKVGRFIYELFTIELLNYIFPKMLLSLDIKDPVDLTVINHDGFKTTLQQVVVKKLNSVRNLYVQSGNNELYTQVLKWTFYVDLFDANLEDFIENVVKIMVNNYDTKILSQMVSI